MAEYPSYLETDVVLRDGQTLRLRPARAADADAVLALFQGLSEQSLFYRFMSLPRLDLARVRQIVDVDYEERFVLVAERGSALAGVAGYDRYPADPARAEVAFAVADALQGRGLGTRLLERLADIARDRGVRAFDAFVLGGNRQMMDVFLRSGFGVKQALEAGVFRVELSLDRTAEYADASAERSQLAATASMRAFFEPKIVAVVGANREPGRIGSEIFRNLRESGFTGSLVPIHPGVESVAGCRAYPTVRDVPGPVDLAIVVVPAARVLQVVDDCIAKDVKALVVISAGFKEIGEEGRPLESALVEKIRNAGIRLIGPNCMGIINTDPAIRLNATFSPVCPPAGRLAFSTQSGALGLAILEYVKRLNLGISSFASIGNKADVSGNDLLQYWAEDRRTDVILLYLESFGNPRKFAQIARRVSRRKPIVAVKAGRSTAGARAASSHTGARATSDALVETLLREAGVIRTDTLEELFDVAAFLGSQPVPTGRRVGIVTNAGGPAILAADACEANGLTLSPLSEATRERLRRVLPPAASVGNPVDMIASASADQYRQAIEIVAADPSIDSLITIFIPPLVTAASDVAAAIRAASTAGKPIIATFMGAQGAPAELAPIPAYTFPESSAVALARVTRYGEWLRAPLDDAEPLEPSRAAAARAIVARSLDAGGGWLSASDGEALVGAVGIEVAGSRIAHTGDEAAAAAAAFGYPVVVKAAGETLLHKTEAGAVKLALESEADVRAACEDLTARLGARIESFIVQPMLSGGVELVVGGLNDPSFGPMVMCGTGGVLVELVGDTAFAMCPVGDIGAAALVERTKARLLLRGFRGAPPVNEPALRSVLVRASQLLDACPEILEMDLNPVVVRQTSAVAADIRIRVGPPARPPADRRIAY